MSELSLALNAFAILDVGLRSNHDQIIEAHDDRLFEGADEAVIGAARSRLTIARDRIEEEVAFLPELSPNKARAVLRALPSAASVNQALQIAQETTNLSRLNVLADLLGRVDDKGKLVSGLIEAHARFDPDAARECLEQARTGSGIGRITDQAWNSALVALRSRHAAILNDTIVGSPQGPWLLARFFEELKASNGSSWNRAIIDELVDRYDRWSQSPLAEIDEALNGAIEVLRQDPSASAPLQLIKSCLKKWDELSQPVQLRDEAKGLDEPRSKKVFEKVRDLAIYLANKHKQYEAALELSRSLEETFPELPSVTALVSEDIDTLAGLIEQARETKVLGPLVSISQQAEHCLPALGQDITKGHFQDEGSGLAADLYRAFEAARVSSKQLSDPALPWKLVRSLAIDLNNDADQPRAARILVVHISGSAPPSIADLLRGDLRALDRRLQTQAFQAALEKGDLDQAHELVSGLISGASAEERRTLEKVRTSIAQRQAKRTLTRLGWGVAAVVLVGVLISSGTERSSSDYGGSTYSDASSEDYTSAADNLEAAADSLEAEASDPNLEEAPPRGYYGSLSIPQLRYCIYEDERLSVMEREATPAAYSMFNDQVRDYNSRCRGTRYDPADRERIDAELVGRRGPLAAEARSRLAEASSLSTSLSDEVSPEPTYQPPVADDPLVGSPEPEGSTLSEPADEASADPAYEPEPTE